MTSDATHLPELTRRQERILMFIVRAYTQVPEPVSSKNHYGKLRHGGQFGDDSQRDGGT